jgi:hypothetical protein
MKYVIICLALLFLAVPAEADDQSGLVDLTGSWKDVRRVSRGGSAQNFTDTTFYDFLPGNEFTSEQKGKYMHRGAYTATSGIVDLGMRIYHVLEMSATRMLLKDDAGTYEFIRYMRPAPVRDKQ